MDKAIGVLRSLIKMKDLESRERGLELWIRHWTATCTISRWIDRRMAGAALADMRSCGRRHAELELGRAVVERCMGTAPVCSDADTERTDYFLTALLPSHKLLEEAQ